jgi:7-cyano-7-deazaguanine synthase
VIDLGTKPDTNIRIKTPVIHLKKSEIVQTGLELGAPLDLTWSCYQAAELACGKCDSCALRLRAFRAAGVRDPIPYQLDSNRFAD